jgi:hypothetical protein
MRCAGRLVSDVKGVGAIPFETGGFFHLPIWCDRIGGESGLCATCERRKERTDEKVAKMTGTSLQGTHPSFLHGIVTEPIPRWSHIYDGTWFRLKLGGGAVVSEENMARAKKIASGLPATGDAPIETKLDTKVDTTPNPKPKPAPKPRKIAPKKPEEVTPIASLEKPVEVDDENVLRIEVKKVEVGGRTVYLSKAKKVYDLKCKYIGRLRDDEIVSFPDSDAD